ncbi:MAG: hypothetical protein IJ446_04770 [Oscillospiraceae bacterium]|nr:hypothetical protein [Oscillospiraceae bacterium]
MKKTVLTAFLCMLLLTACSDNEAVSVSEPDYCVTGESLAVSEPTYCVTGESLAAVSEADTVTETTTGPNRRNINNNGMMCLLTDDIPVDKNGVHDIRCFGTHIITDEHSLKRRTDILGNDKIGSELEKYSADTDFENEYIACTLIPVNSSEQKWETGEKGVYISGNSIEFDCIITDLTDNIRDKNEYLFVAGKIPKFEIDPLMIDDPWGISLTAEDITADSVTVRYSLFKETDMKFTYEDITCLERLDDNGEWQCADDTDQLVCIVDGHNIPAYSSVTETINIGKQESGSYRIGKMICGQSAYGGFTDKMYYAYFDIQ